MERIHLIFISHSIVNEYICSTTAFIWWRARAPLSQKILVSALWFWRILWRNLCSGWRYKMANFRRINEEEKRRAYLRAAPNITTSVIHPGSCKQSVPFGLSIIWPNNFCYNLTILLWKCSHYSLSQPILHLVDCFEL